MAKANYWKFGSRYAGVTARGKRFVVDTLAQAKAKMPKSGKTRTSSKVKKTKTKTRKRTMARKKKGKSRRKLRIPLAVASGVGYMLAGGKYPPLEAAMRGDYIGTLKRIAHRTIGLHPATGQWDPKAMLQGTGAILLGVGVHKVASMLGANRAIAQTGIPFLSI